MSKRIASLALALLLALCAPGLAEEAVELTGWYGRDIAGAAQAVGGLQYASDEEYPDIYEGDAVTLRGDGTVSLIELKGGGYALMGVSVGMNRVDALGLLADVPQLWNYDEEVAFMVADAGSGAEVMLVLFFDDGGKVDGAWYRAAE